MVPTRIARVIRIKARMGVMRMNTMMRRMTRVKRLS
jgi:hypothetical protein